MTEEMIRGAMQCPLLRGIDRERLPEVLREIDAVCVKIQRGEPVRLDARRSLAVVLEGRLQIVQHDYWGTRSIIHMLVPGKMIGESFTWFEGFELNQQTLAQTDCTLLAFSRDRLLGGGFAEQRMMLENLLWIYGVHQRVFLQKFHLLSRRKTRDRMLAYLSQLASDRKSAEFDLPFTRQELADYLCVERSAMCTELSALQREGVLRFKGRHIELLQPGNDGEV